eukprot:CAMPEP_0206496378 /NCGR_PEP_ID=MMETSP0324_2-20121206/49347_1 /ASSEMBLY_ACC=CAM_ASM_000836 /TAXON_ID=2866 /ORGANISM="Crypthecodinium cohnii, Strain Seligo" /LENGTH=342 /DNA_ID=CAMNT_0053981331 /DNA_START=92 /DNA_END=1120 /DNA_ORIENTATION=-
MLLGRALQVLSCGGVVTYQLRCGRQIAKGDGFADQMANYVYMVVNTLDRTAILIDAAWDIDGIYELAEQLGVRIRGAVYTHFHFDHCGGRMSKSAPTLPGALEVQQRGGEIWAGEGDAARILDQCSLEGITALKDGEVLECGDLLLHALRTPGHTPGSICLFASPQCLSPRGSLAGQLEKERMTVAEKGLLITGDTLFVGSCGRTDLPGSNQMDMFGSLARLSTMHPEVIVLPGHDYHPRPFTTIGMERELNLMMQAGLNSVPKPLSLPPCCTGDLAGGRCGPKGFIIGRKFRLREKKQAAAVLEDFDEKEGKYAVRLLEPSSPRALVSPEALQPASAKPTM